MERKSKWYFIAVLILIMAAIIGAPLMFAGEDEPIPGGGDVPLPDDDDEEIPPIPPEGPTGPSQDEIDAALEALANELGIDVSELTDDQINEVTENLQAAWEEANSNQSDTAGDPVLVTSGKYVLETMDLEINGSRFNIVRKYISEEKTVGSLGAGWLVSLDSRIIRGIDSIDNAKLEKAEKLTAEIRSLYNQIVTPSIANRVYLNIYLPAKEKVDSLRAKKQRSDELAALNQYVRFRGAPSYYEEIGSGMLTLIDENGIPIVFEPFETGVWKPVNYPEKLFLRLETRDRNGAESESGFLLYGKGGTVREYGGNGFLAKITKIDGTCTIISRDQTGRIKSITGPHFNEWKVNYAGNFISSITGPESEEVCYGYAGDELAWVKDICGDTIRFVYETGRLKQIIKPDGSSITQQYGYTGASGSLLVTAVTNEEGFTERFEYSQDLFTTIHYNHSGIFTIFKYDENHRTVYEESSSGKIKTYGYNALGLPDWENTNGFETVYSHDSRGNITEKSHSDGTNEKWEWNSSDRITAYTNPDGIRTEYRFDYSGNCTEILRAGQVVFSGRYDSNNRLIAATEGDRGEIRYEYDSSDYLKAKIITVNGQEIRESWEYDGLGRVTKYTDGIGRIWKYLYHKNEKVEITPLGLHRHYFYNSRKDLVHTLEKDPVTGEEREIFLEYDRRHLPVRVTDGSGNETLYEYRADGELALIAKGPWYRKYDYDTGGRISEVISGMTGSSQTSASVFSYAWQAGGFEYREVSQQGSGVTGYLVDPRKRITSITNALGETSIRTFNGAGNPVQEQAAAGGFFEYRYDNSGRLAGAGREGEPAVHVKYNRDGSISEKTDRLGNVTRYAYDARGLLISETNALGEDRYFHDNAGRVIKIETLNRNGSVYYTEYRYNDSLRTMTVTAGGKYSETVYLNAWGQAIKHVDGEGNERRIEYDKNGKIAVITDGYGHSVNYFWNELEKISSITYIDSMREDFEYDHLGNVSKIKNNAGTVWAGEYDEAGRLIKETGWPGIDREYSYDSLGRITEVKNGGMTAEKYKYSNRGREVTFTDGSGASFVQQKNPYAELTGEVNRVQDVSGYKYDSEGRAVLFTAFSGKQTKLDYRDAEGICITTYDDGARDIIELDKRGNIIRVENSTGVILYKYDAGGKLAEQVDDGAREITRYVYDRAGRRIRMTSGNRDVQYQYGKNGELLRLTDHGQRLQVSYEYDARGRETKRIYGNGIRQETFYDQAGRVVLIKETDTQNYLLRAEGYLYDEKGRRFLCVDEEGRITGFEYDRQSKLITVLYPWTNEKTESDRMEAEEAGLFFTQDKGYGERYSIGSSELAALKNILNTAAPFLGNIIEQNQSVWRESFTYDKNGNRSSKTTPWGTIKYEYDAENRLIKKGDIVFTNDRDGNVLNEKGLRYEAVYGYNGQNRMIYSEVTNHAFKSFTANWYEYDALGRRTITENAAGLVLRTLYDGKGFEVIREGETFLDKSLTTQYSNVSSANNARTSAVSGERYRWIGGDGEGRTSEPGYTVQGNRYGGRGVILYGRGEAVAVSYSSGSSSRSLYLGKDIQGSVRSATTDSGVVDGLYEYDAFGQPYKGDLGGTMNLGYTGKPYDTATGFYNYGYRDYRPQTARFTTSDPIRDGNNWFAYVNNDPVNWVDLWGLLNTTNIDNFKSHISFDDISFKPETISAAMKENIDNLTKAQDITREADMYEMGGGGRYPNAEAAKGSDKTFCNQATFDIAIATGFNQDALFNGEKRDNVNANTAAANLAAAAANGTIVQLTEADAQRMANLGYTVIVAWENPNPNERGHLATVVPDPSKNILTTSPTISNVGQYNGIMNVNDPMAFGTKSVSYYYDPNQKFDKFDLSDVAQRKEPKLEAAVTAPKSKE